MSREDVEFLSEGTVGPGLAVQAGHRDGPVPDRGAGRRLVLRARARHAVLRRGVRRRRHRGTRLRLPQPRRLGRRAAAAPGPVGADPRLPERAQLPRAPRRRGRGTARRLGHLVLGRPRAGAGRDRPQGEGDRQPDPGGGRLPQHAPRARHHGLPPALADDPGGPRHPVRGPGEAAVPPARHRRRRRPRSRRGRSRRRTTPSRRSRSPRRRCTRTAAPSSPSTCC